MTTSVFELFKLGVGPSSSHTMGPMTAANRFLSELASLGRLSAVGRVSVTLYGSLALTGRGHATDRAAMLGLMGALPATLDPDEGEAALAKLELDQRLGLGLNGPVIAFSAAQDIVWRGDMRLPRHPNAIRFSAYFGEDEAAFDRVYYSVGGGFVADDGELDSNRPPEDVALPFPYTSGVELLDMAQGAALTIAELMMANETARRPQAEVEAGLETIFQAMETCIDRGMRQAGELPGGLKVKRRARALYEDLKNRAEQHVSDPLIAMDWINLWALAVNEENAAGGRMVTAPTNGAAGIVPAVLRYYDRFHRGGAEGRSCSPPARSERSINATPRSRAQRSGVKARSASPVRWPPPVSPPRWAALTPRSRTPPKSPWSIISASPAIPLAALSRSPASSATPWARSRPLTPRASPWSATASIRSVSTR